uniref:Reverse transcriptase domain-containing protein n=2 Tax=Podarcis TaxID=42163 RepID=A0A670HTQ3_PODMU
MANLKAITLNVRGLGNPIKRKRITSYINTMKPHITFLQEIHNPPKGSKLLSDPRFSQQWVAGGSGKARGVAIILSRDLNFTATTVLKDKKGRFIFAKGTLDGKIKLTIGSIYAPNTKQLEFFQKTLNKFLSFSEGEAILGGDLNLNMKGISLKDIHHTTPWATFLRRKPPTTRNSYKLLKMLKNRGLYDIWGEQNPGDISHTFQSGRHDTVSRLDSILLTQGLIPSVESTNIGNIKITDHAPVEVTVKIGEGTQTTPSWSFSPILTTNKQIRESLTKTLQNYFKENDVNNTTTPLLWDAMKAVTRGACIKEKTFLKKQTSSKISKIEQDITVLLSRYKQTGSKKLLKLIEQKRKELDSLEINKTMINILYSKQRFYEYGGKNSRLLANRCRKKALKTRIHCITKKDGNITFSPKEIISEFAEFYSNLYTSHNPPEREIKKFLAGLTMPTLTDEEQEFMDSPITPEEIDAVLKNLKPHKAPGPDGFTAEFYKKFKEPLMPYMTRLFNDIIKGGPIPKTWTHSKIVSIPKPLKDSLKVESYRPISLINQDYKIFTSILANRLKIFLHKLIAPDQTGFVPGRNITDPIRKLLNLIEHSKATKLPLTIMSLDILKAFDCLEWKYILAVLTNMKFGPNFLQILKQIYSQASAKCRTNNMDSNTIAIQRGTKQGCPLSPFLFILALEPLAIRIRAATDIKGVEIKGRTYKLGLFADDLMVTTPDPISTATSLIRELNAFAMVSGLQVNFTKSEAMCFNTPPHTQKELTKVTKIKLCHTKFRYLGVQITRNLNKLYLHNYKPLWRQINKDLKRWNNMNLTLSDKIAMIKMTTLPKLTYLFQTLPIWIPSTQLHSWQRKLHSFIFSHKKPRISPKYLHLPTSEGGWGIPNIEAYYTANQIRHIIPYILEDETKQWVHLERDTIENTCTTTYPLLPDKLRKIPTTLNRYTQTMLKAWKTQIGKLSPTPSPLIPLAYHPLFHHAAQNLQIKTWRTKGLYRLIDFYKNNKPLSTQEIQDKLEDTQMPWLTQHQLHALLNNPTVKSAATRPLTTFENLLLTTKGNGKGMVSAIYKILLQNPANPLDAIKKQWENDIGYEINPTQWTRMWSKPPFKSISTKRKELTLKLTYRWYLTPRKLALIHPGTSPKCWRGCTSTGTYFHMWWECPKIQLFWTTAIQEICKITKQVIDTTPELALLNIFQDNNAHLHHKELITHLLSAARNTITRHWRDLSGVSMDQWYQIVWETALLEKLTNKLKLTRGQTEEDAFTPVWLPFITHTAQQDNDNNPPTAYKSIWLT